MTTNENSGDNISKESEESSDSELSGSELDVSSDQDTIIDVFTESSDDDRAEYRPQMGWTTVLSDKNIAHFNLTGGPELPRNIDMNSSPLEYFYLMLSESIYIDISNETNKYVELCKQGKLTVFGIPQM